MRPLPDLAIRLAGVALFAAAVVLAGCQKVSDAEHVQRAKERHAAGDLRASIIELKNALQRNANNADARFLLGQAYVELGDGASAEKELGKARELGAAEDALRPWLQKSLWLQGKLDQVLALAVPAAAPPEVRAEMLAVRGEVLLQQSRFEEAMREFQAALAVWPQAPAPLVGIARLAAARGELQRARGQLDKALASDSRYGPAWSLLADLERHQGRIQEAEHAYSKAIALRFDNGADRLKRALVRVALRNYEGAREDIAVLKGLNRLHPGVHYAEGLAYFAQRRYAQAQTAFEEALKHGQGYRLALLYLGAVHYVQNHLEQAAQYLNQYVRDVPGSDAAAKLLAAVRLRQGDHAGAESILRPMLARNPDDPVTLNLMGTAALSRGDTKEGIAYLQKFVAQQPQSADAHGKIGLALLLQGEERKGMAELESAIEIDPKLQAPQVLVILNHLRTREFDQALAAAQRLRENRPDVSLALNLVGLAYLGKGLEDKAAEAFREALKISPGDPGAAHNLAALALRKGDRKTARGLYEQILKHRTDHLPTLLALAELEAREGQLERAKERLEHAMRVHPKALQPRVLLARYYTRTGQPDRTLAITREVQSTYPDNPALLTEVGEAQLARGDPTSAVATFKRLVGAMSKSAGTHYLLAKAHAEAGNAKQLRRELETALSLDPSHFPARLAMIRLLLLENKPKDAEKRLAELRKTYPERAEVLAQQGWLAMRQGRSEEAAQAYREAFRRDPDSRLAVALAQAEWAAGERTEAVATMERWVKEHPQDSLARLALADAYLAMGRAADAKTAYASVIKKDPNNLLALNNLAWLLRRVEPAKALEYAERAHRLAPGRPAVIDTLGVLLVEQGQAARAVVLLRDAAQQSPGSLGIRYHLALALARSGEEAEAMRLLGQLLGDRTRFAERDEAEALLRQLRGS